MGADPHAIQSMVQVLNGFRPGTWAGHYVIVRRSGAAYEWTVAQLTTDSDRPFDYLRSASYASEDEARAAVVRLASNADAGRGRP